MAIQTSQLRGAALPIHFLKHFTASIPGASAYSILAGGIGAIIMIMFLTGLFSLDFLSKFIPWILGFNAAVTGYALIDKIGADNLRERLPHHRVLVFCSGALMVMLVCLLLTLSFGYGTLVTLPHLLFYGVIGTVFSGLGGWLAVKYHQLKS